MFVSARNPAEQGQRLRMVLMNCAADRVSLWPTYKKPFDLIFQRKEWSTLADDFRSLVLASTLPDLAYAPWASI